MSEWSSTESLIADYCLCSSLGWHLSAGCCDTGSTWIDHFHSGQFIIAGKAQVFFLITLIMDAFHLAVPRIDGLTHWLNSQYKLNRSIINIILATPAPVRSDEGQLMMSQQVLWWLRMHTENVFAFFFCSWMLLWTKAECLTMST